MYVLCVVLPSLPVFIFSLLLSNFVSLDSGDLLMWITESAVRTPDAVFDGCLTLFFVVSASVCVSLLCSDTVGGKDTSDIIIFT